MKRVFLLFFVLFVAPLLFAQRDDSATIPDNFVQINGGTFTMDSPANEAGRYSSETQWQVVVSFLLERL